VASPTRPARSPGWDLPRVDVVEHALLAESTCITAPPALVLQTEDGPQSSLTSFAGFSVGDVRVRTDGATMFTVSADGKVSEGAHETEAAGLPKVFPLDDPG